MKKNIIISLILLAVLIVGGVFAYSYVSKLGKTPTSVAGNSGIVIATLNGGYSKEITSPLKITGFIKGDGWTGFEGQVGTVKLLDNEGREMGATFLQATTDWMQLPTNFEAEINFTSDKDINGTLVFRNENASGLPEKDKTFVVPVKILKSSQQQAAETMKVKAYFSNNAMDPQISCNKVFAVEREIPKIEAVATAAINELLKGPTSQEEGDGYYTSLNNNVRLQSLEITKEGVAKADFDERLQEGVGGSCRVSAIRAQITETLKQFPTVKGVIISVNGDSETSLQP